MSRRGLAVVAAAMLGALASPAGAGEWQYDPATDLVFYGSVPVARWYGERPSKPAGAMRAGPRHDRSYVRVPPRCPHRLCGYPLPIHEARRPVVKVVRVVPRYRVVVSAHVAWCAARYRSYDVATDTYQPYHGPRRRCASPYR